MALFRNLGCTPAGLSGIIRVRRKSFTRLSLRLQTPGALGSWLRGKWVCLVILHSSYSNIPAVGKRQNSLRWARKHIDPDCGQVTLL